MKTMQQSSRRSDHRGRRSRGRGVVRRPVQKSWWDKIAEFFLGPQKRTSENGAKKQPKQVHRQEVVEVTSPKLYVGNLSFDATESDLFDLFNGVGSVQNAEIISHRQTQRSKGFAFVTMQSIDEAQRAVKELHDKEFMGRKLVVSGAKSTQ
jgi:RNA recognition motif-containing protein